MIRLTTYLIPTVFGSRITMEYRIITCKRDMRTKFCKRNEKYIIDTNVLNNLIDKYDLIVKDERLITRNGKQAYVFSRALKEDKKNTLKKY